MEIAIVIGIIIVLLIIFIFASYIKAPTDRALIVSGLRKHPKFVIGKSALRIPFLQRVDRLELKMISVDVKTKESLIQPLRLRLVQQQKCLKKQPAIS